MAVDFLSIFIFKGREGQVKETFYGLPAGKLDY